MTIFATQAQRFGIAKESVRGTAETTPTKWYPTREIPDLNYRLEHLEDPGIRGSFLPYPPKAGMKIGEGSIPVHADAQMLGEILNSLLGSVSSAEDSTITINSANKYLDFDIGGGELTATISEASYPIGTDQTEAGTLCKAIYDAIVAAEGAGTYTVTYSRTTKLFTITRSAGTLSILWKTGTHGADNADDHVGTTIGYDDSADDTGSLSYVGDNTIEYAFTHTVTPGTDIQKQSYTLFQDRSMGILKYNLGVCKSIDIKSSVDGLIEVDTNWLFKSEATGLIGSPSFPTQEYFGFQDVDFKIAASSNTKIKEWNLSIDNGAFALRTQNTSQDCEDIIADQKLMVEGSFKIYFENTTERDKFLANTSVALNMVISGDTIAGSSTYKIDINVYAAHYTAFPYGEDEGLLAADVTFKGFYSSGDAKLVQIALTNQDASY